MNQDEGQSSNRNDDAIIGIICDKIVQKNDSIFEVEAKGIPRFIENNKIIKHNGKCIIIILHNFCYCMYN